MPIKGSLKEAGLADVCQLLAMGQKTGRLSVTDRSRFGQIFFDRGKITFATIVNRRDRLGDLLIREGVITHEELMQAVDAQVEQPDRRLGELLLERGLIDTDTLTSVIQAQIEEAIYYLFTWSRGNFYFEVGQTPDSGEVLISVNPESLLLEGARRVDEWSVIAKRIPSLDLIFKVDAARIEAANVDLTEEQQSLLPFLEGKLSVEEIAEASGLGEFETGRALYGLIHAGFAQRVGQRQEPAAGTDPDDVDEARNLGIAFYRTAMLDEADREFRRVLTSQPHDPVSRHYLALIALRRGEPEDAVRRLTALLESAGPRTGAYLNLAYALRLQGRFADALSVLRQARERAPDDPRVALAEGATLLSAGDVPAARTKLAAYRDAAGADDSAPAAYYYAAGLGALVAGEHDEADSRVAEGLEAHPGSAPLHLLAGVLAERAADTAAAAELYQRAAEEDPNLPQTHKNLGDLAMRRNAPAEALEHYRRAASLEPDLGDDLYTRLGDIHYRRKERDEAIRCWKKAVELNPANETARNHLEVVTGAGA